MLIKNLSGLIKTLDGKKILLDAETPLTFRLAFVTALLNSDAKDTTGKERFHRYQIAAKLSGDEDEVTISIEDLGKLKELVGLHWLPAVVGPCWLLLEQEEEGGE